MKCFLKVVLAFHVAVMWQIVKAQDTKITYAESNLDFPNPERGFYIPSEYHSGSPVALQEAALRKNRVDLQKHGSASYAIYATLIFRNYVLGQFIDQPISLEFLNAMQQDFDVVRKAGLKMIIRFSYINKVHSNGCADKEGICPPYGDAPKAIVLKHIAQLKPYLHKNADIIAVLQQGFIGIWGENYYTDYFGDASENGAGKIMDSSWRDRNDMLKALLDALPEDRMVQVRTPQIKQKYVYGPDADVSSTPMSPEAAYSGKAAARIGFHNDCFLASVDDYGTYYDYGSSATPKKPANGIMRKYVEADSRYTPVGGETCDDAFSLENDCAPAGHAEEEMAAMHYSYLNTAYNNKVNNDWDSMGCMNSIKRRLGYRFVLQDAVFPAAGKAGETFTFTIHLVNRGYAAPFNPRSAELILRNTKSKEVFTVSCKVDTRYWFSGDIEWKEAIKLPANIPAGNYELLLNLPDKYSSLSKRPEYSIQLANENTWEPHTGYNKLN
ncbi:MAG TPA: DUF4832 domain-containing protein, partial [Agriterribacter sp.]|nr:DUF4832 domain-containing protein [Agriterribacter sp.]